MIATNMVNRRRISVDSEGCITVRVNVEPQLWELSGQLAKQWHVDQIQALGIILEKLTRLIEAGKAEFLGPEFVYAFNKLVMADKLSVGGMPPVEVAKLHRSTRTKSGFVGVYANGKGFRSMAATPDGNGLESIGTFPTAEQAAWARYLHHKKFKLPYGEAEDRLETERAEIRDEVERNRKLCGEYGNDDEYVLRLINDVRDASGVRPMTMEELRGGTSSEPATKVNKVELFGIKEE